MVEEEAFLRRIIDSSGDDLSRLIYSDWLEEREDPRAQFLRAEVEWAKPWKDGQRPTDPIKLRAVASDLDPLWVARLSRPPLGVCCDHIVVKHSGTHLSAAVLEECQRRLNVNFAIPLTAMLLNRNGGRPRASIYRSPRTGDRDGIHWFFPATVDTLPPKTHPLVRDTSIESFWAYINSGQAANNSLNRDRAFLPFAFGEEMGLFAVGLTVARFGKIYRFATGSAGFLRSPKLVDDCMTEFLAGVTKLGQ